MIVNWQLKNQLITILVCTEQQNIEHTVIVNIFLGGPEFSPFNRSRCRNRQLCLARQEQHCHQVAPDKSDIDFTRQTQLWFNQHKTSSPITRTEYSQVGNL